MPQEPLSLFQHFVPLSLVSGWVNSLLEKGVVNSWGHELKQESRLQSWTPTSAAEIYVWLEILNYIGIHKESEVKDH
jgi:hypothetical protein